MRFYLTLALCLFLPNFAAAQQEHIHKHPAPVSGNVSLLVFPERVPEAGQSIRVITQLTQDGKPLEADNLKTVHTQKFHLLIVDPTLTDYQHIHPEPTATPGSYLFTFTPKFPGGYRAWADVTPMGGAQQFARANIAEIQPAAIDKTDSSRAEAGDYRFELRLDGTPKVGSMTMATVFVTQKNGAPFSNLEPVMGAFAHLVGFYEDYETVLHAHPMGSEPKDTTARGGPELMFHLAPEKSGFIKLFAQFKIGGKDVFVPFGIHVSP